MLSSALLDETNELSNGNGTTNGVGGDASYKVNEQPIRTRRPIRVACMGAGYSGLMMGIMFSEQMKDKNADLVIYERNKDLGGTWLENRYVPSLYTKAAQSVRSFCMDESWQRC